MRVAPNACDAPPALLRGAGADTGRRRLDFVRIGKTRVVAVETAPRVVRAGEPSAGEPPACADLDCVVAAVWLGHCEVRGVGIRRGIDRRDSLSRIADFIDVVAIDQGAEVLDSTRQFVV